MTNPPSLQPFASFLAARAIPHSTLPVQPDLQTSIQTRITGGTWVDLTTSLVAAAGLQFAFTFEEMRPVAWAGPSGPSDLLNHLVIGFRQGDFAAIYVSDSELKTALLNALANGEIAGWEPVPQSILMQTYVSTTDIKTLWLAGAHRPVSVKPDSKIISGRQLEHALDPFGDSTYVAGAIRSNIQMGLKQRTVGVSLRRSGIWFGPCGDWTSFTTFADHMLNALNAANATTPIKTIPGLATILHSFNGVGKAYIIEWSDPDTNYSTARMKRLTKLRTEYEMQCHTSPSTAPGQFEVEVTALTQASLPTGNFILTPTFKGDNLAFKVSPNSNANFQGWINAVEADTELIRVYYTSGHSIANGQLALSNVQDRDFLFSFADFSGSGCNYLLTREKPPGNPVPFADIEKAADVSLFKWVYRDGLSQLGLTQPTPNSCWLFTDDGSGEVADFVLLDLTNATSPKLTLIHVKGAGSESPKRLPSPGAYEVVSAQAMKNLRRMQAGNLYEEIEKTLRSGAVKRVWDQPWQQAANTSTTATTDFLSAVGQLNSIASTVKHEVIIVQPHVLKSKYKPTGAKKKWATATQQLRALLFGVQAMAKSASADFRVVADMR